MLAKKKKIALVVPSLAVGGAQRMIAELVRSLDSSRYNVRVYCFADSDTPSFIEESIIASGVPVCHLGNFSRLRFREMRVIWKALIQFDPDVVHAHLGGVQASLLWCIVRRKLLVITLHTTMPSALNPFAARVLNLGIGRDIIRLICVSGETCTQSMRYFDFKAPKLSVIPNGIDLAHYGRCSQSGQTVFINVGTQNENKNQTMLFDAFELLRSDGIDCKLILVGDGPKHAELASRSAGREDVILPGKVKDVAHWLEKANVYVQCSLREAMPMSILEAIASGLPVISTDVGGIRNVIRPGKEGLLINPASPASLADAMRTLCDRSTREEYSIAALERAKCFSSKLMADSYSRVYDGIDG